MEQRPCRNCGTPVTGEYCSHCGQREGRAEQRFLDLAGELAGDVVDLDSEDIAEAFVEEGENPEDWDGEISLADENSPQWLQELDTRAEQNITKLKGDPNEFVETMVSYLPLAFHCTYGSRLGAALGKAIFVYVSYGVLMVQGFFVVALMALVLL